ncbi:MAG: phosphate transport system permease protein [Solirubrobacteraceae bacterium]|jgi:phosphate transport system permease protein|nr:phosphate transport system permease protein [Solirubrobacteraceae bacterium]
MTAATVERPVAMPPERRGPQDGSASWRLTDRLGLALAWFLGLLYTAIAAAIVIYLLVQGLKYLRPELFVESPAAGFGEKDSGGFLDPLMGTLIVAVMAMAIAFPIGLGVGVWLSEYGRPFWLARVIESSVEMLAGVPSIVFALFGTLIFQSPALGFLTRTNANGLVFGRSFFAASTMLSLIAIPLLVASVREGLQAIPGHVREASYAVGKTKIATTRRILLPTARPAVITGTMLGFGRLIGDTAIIVLLLGATLRFETVGDTPVLGTLRGTGSTLTTYVYQNAPTGEGNLPTKAYAAAFVLLMIVLALNVVAEIVGRRGKDLR